MELAEFRGILRREKNIARKSTTATATKAAIDPPTMSATEDELAEEFGPLCTEISDEDEIVLDV